MNIHSKIIKGTKGLDKRKEILQAALELIVEHGFHGSPMAMIAEKAGVAAGTIYLYFESKEVLINELYKVLEKEVVEGLMAGYNPSDSIKERFLHLATALIRYFIAHPFLFRYIEQYHNSPYGVSLRRDRILEGASGDNNVNIFKRLFDEGVKKGVLKDFPLIVLFALAFGPLDAIARNHILGFIILDDKLISDIVESCWDAIKR